jgi:hypothetical protein
VPPCYKSDVATGSSDGCKQAFFVDPRPAILTEMYKSATRVGHQRGRDVHVVTDDDGAVGDLFSECR